MDRKFSGTWLLCLLAALAVGLTSCMPKRGELPPPITGAKTFDEVFSSDVPYDVDMSFLENQLFQFFFLLTEFTRAQAFFDVYAWQVFMALNWPIDGDGQPLAEFGDDSAKRQWSRWKEPWELFREDGGPPTLWAENAATANRTPPRSFIGALERDERRPLFNLSATQELTALEGTHQAFSAVLYDQSGRSVYYESLINEVEYDYIVKHGLYNIDGQIEFFKRRMREQLEPYDPERPLFIHTKSNPALVEFPRGSNKRKKHGAMELKFAWKVLGDDDIPARFFTETAMVLEADGSWSEEQVGLVGMHIVAKTERSPQGVWMTFAHVDNLKVPAGLSGKNPKGKTVPLKASFSDPSCEDCVPNTTRGGADGRLRTQVERVIPIPKGLRRFNTQVRGLIAQTGSAFQYYELVDSQWSASEFIRGPAGGDSSLHRRINNKGGGIPTPVFLTNAVLETFAQKGYQPVAEQVAVERPGDEQSIVYATESCVGCHSDASIAIEYRLDGNGQIDRSKRPGPVRMPGQLAGDYSYMFLKAHYRQPAD